MKRRPVIVAGPTASGKSALALAIARRDDGVVVNADALQVYECWRVLTARPTQEDEARVPHALYGHVSCSAAHSVGDWLRALRPALAAAGRRRPVIVGGTGLYLTALTEGLAEIPAVPTTVRTEAEAILAAEGIEGLGGRLAAEDPGTWAAIDRNNPARVRRAWEVRRATGRGLKDWQRAQARPVMTDAVRLVLDMPTARLDRRIAARFRAMLEAGALDEGRAALAAGWDPRRPSAKALGAAELVAYLRGELELDEAERRAVLATRRYAKRQRTWFRNRLRKWTRVDADGSDCNAVLASVPEA